MSNRPLVLASTSQYRAQLLRQLGVEFSTFKAEIDESPLLHETPKQTCQRLALAKARNAIVHSPQNALIIGSDQVLDMDGIAVSKPGAYERAFSQLQSARGRAITCYTALALVDADAGRTWTDVVPTIVEHRVVTDAEIETYLTLEKPFDCAGSLKVETRGISLLKRVSSDDPTALVGLPLIRLTDFLREAGYNFTQ